MKNENRPHNIVKKNYLEQLVEYQRKNALTLWGYCTDTETALFVTRPDPTTKLCTALIVNIPARDGFDTQPLVIKETLLEKKMTRTLAHFDLFLLVKEFRYLDPIFICMSVRRKKKGMDEFVGHTKYPHSYQRYLLEYLPSMICGKSPTEFMPTTNMTMTFSMLKMNNIIEVTVEVPKHTYILTLQMYPLDMPLSGYAMYDINGKVDNSYFIVRVPDTGATCNDAWTFQLRYCGQAIRNSNDYQTLIDFAVNHKKVRNGVKHEA